MAPDYVKEWGVAIWELARFRAIMTIRLEGDVLVAEVFSYMTDGTGIPMRELILLRQALSLIHLQHGRSRGPRVTVSTVASKDSLRHHGHAVASTSCLMSSCVIDSTHHLLTCPIARLMPDLAATLCKQTYRRLRNSSLLGRDTPSRRSPCGRRCSAHAIGGFPVAHPTVNVMKRFFYAKSSHIWSTMGRIPDVFESRRREKPMKRHLSALGIAVGMALVCLTSCLHAPVDNLPQLMADLFDSQEDASVQSAIAAIVAAQPNPEQVAQALRVGPTEFADVEPGWHVFEFACRDGITRNVHLYIPSTYDPATAHTLLVSLHGAVDYTAYTVDEFISRYAMWESVAQRDGFIVLMPHGDRDATWWSENGRQYLHDLLYWVKALCRIDDNKVFLAGFSDGASGAYWMAFHDSTAWAGFIPIYGSISVPERGPYACYPDNLRSRPILACNGMGESYAPIETAWISQLRSYGLPIQWVLHQTEHNLAQTMPYERNRSATFIADTSRDPFSTTLEWRTSDTRTGRCDWISIDAITPDQTESRWEDINLGWEYEVTHFGAGLQYQGVARGFEVVGVEPGSIAQSFGLKLGDKLLFLDGEAVVTNADVAEVMSYQQPGETLTAEILREGARLELQCVLPEVPMIYRRDIPTAAVRAQVSGNVIRLETQRVDALRIFVSRVAFDLSQPICVIVNGQEMFHAKVLPNLAFMLDQWSRDRDREIVYEGVIEISIAE